MASKTKTVYVCSACGHETSKWYGQCPACQEWNTMEEELRTVETGSAKKRALSAYANRASVQKLQEISADTEHRFDTGLRELKRLKALLKKLPRGEVCIPAPEAGEEGVRTAWVPLKEAAGEIAARAVGAYPPGCATAAPANG